MIMLPVWAWLLMSFAFGASASLNAVWLLEKYARHKREMQIHVHGPELGKDLAMLIEKGMKQGIKRG